MEIIAKGLTKKFGSKIAVNHVDIDVRPGKVLGLLGPNGAGKSTTIKMLAGQMRPDAGEIVIDGDTHHHVLSSLRNQIGVMLQDTVLWDELKLEESLYFMATLQGLDQKTTKQRVDWVMNKLQLAPERKTISKNLSGGYKRRLHLALTVIGKPALLFLDEPSPGIDPQSRRLMLDFIAELRDSGQHAIILTDHYMDEVEKICDYVQIIDHGKVIAQGTVPELKRDFGEKNLVQINLAPETPTKTLAAFKNALAKELGIAIDGEGSSVIFPAEHVGKTVEIAMQILRAHKLEALNLSVKEPSLEDVFLSLTGRHAR
jgi:ABC-2 type transport system ATP-binding protein